MAQDGLELNTVNTKNGPTSVLNLRVVKYWTPENQASPAYKLTLWGEQAERHVSVIKHNQTVYIEADLGFESYDQTFTLADGTEKVITRQTPVFRRPADFRLVDVVKVPKIEDSTPSADDEITSKASAASKSKAVASTQDTVPF